MGYTDLTANKNGHSGRKNNYSVREKLMCYFVSGGGGCVTSSHRACGIMTSAPTFIYSTRSPLEDRFYGIEHCCLTLFTHNLRYTFINKMIGKRTI